MKCDTFCDGTHLCCEKSPARYKTQQVESDSRVDTKRRRILILENRYWRRSEYLDRCGDKRRIEEEHYAGMLTILWFSRYATLL